MIAEHPHDSARNKRIAAVNAGNLMRLRKALPADHDAVQAALAQRGPA